MSPMKIPKQPFFGFKMKFSMYLDYTRKISEFPPCGKGEKEGERFPLFQTIFKGSKFLEANLEIFKEIVQKTGKNSHFLFPLPAAWEFGNFTLYGLYTYKTSY